MGYLPGRHRRHPLLQRLQRDAARDELGIQSRRQREHQHDLLSRVPKHHRKQPRQWGFSQGPHRQPDGRTEAELRELVCLLPLAHVADAYSCGTRFCLVKRWLSRGLLDHQQQQNHQHFRRLPADLRLRGNAEELRLHEALRRNGQRHHAVARCAFKIGRYYSGKFITTNEPDPIQYACQRNYVLLSTDGYWNTGDETSRYGPDDMDGNDVGNQDGREAKPMSDGTNNYTLYSRTTYTVSSTRYSRNTCASNTASSTGTYYRVTTQAETSTDDSNWSNSGSGSVTCSAGSGTVYNSQTAASLAGRNVSTPSTASDAQSGGSSIRSPTSRSTTTRTTCARRTARRRVPAYRKTCAPMWFLPRAATTPRTST